MVLQVNGVDLHYETVGEGEPLLWLYGFMGAGPDWKYIFDAGPPAGYRLIAPDMRGHGRSTTAPCHDRAWTSQLDGSRQCAAVFSG